MSVTNPSHVDTAIPELWAMDVLREHSLGEFWGRFVGNAIVQKYELLNKPGDLIHIQVTNPLTGAGVEGDLAVLEGNEENLETSEIKCSPVLYRHGVRYRRRANKKSIVDLRMEARNRIAEWGMVKLDTLRFTNFVATSLAAPLASEAYTPNVYCSGTGNSAVDDIAVGDTLTVEEIQEIKVTLEDNLAKPIVMDGMPVYALVTHPYSLLKLKRSDEYRDWVREAHMRGAENPFFRGATAMIDGVVIFSHARTPRAANSGSVQVAKALAFGAEAFVEALDENPSWDEDEFDYGAQIGIAYEFAVQPRRALELSSLQVLTSAPSL